MALQLTIFEGSVEIAEGKPRQLRQEPPKIKVSYKLSRKYRTLGLYKMYT